MRLDISAKSIATTSIAETTAVSTLLNPFDRPPLRRSRSLDVLNAFPHPLTVAAVPHLTTTINTDSQPPTKKPKPAFKLSLPHPGPLLFHSTTTTGPNTKTLDDSTTEEEGHDAPTSTEAPPRYRISASGISPPSSSCSVYGSPLTSPVTVSRFHSYPFPGAWCGVGFREESEGLTMSALARDAMVVEHWLQKLNVAVARRRGDEEFIGRMKHGLEGLVEREREIGGWVD